MPSKHQWEDSQAVHQLQAVFDSPVLLHVKTRILIHGRARKSDPACPCCGSKHARIVEERPDLDLLVDRVTGERRLRSEVQDVEAFDRLAATARRVDIPLRCHKGQLRLLLDTKHKIVGSLGGNRSGKTTTGVYWMVRQWILRGGKGATFWWVAPQRSQTLIGVEKLVTGEVSDRPQPPALPLDPVTDQPILAVRWPETQRSSDQRIIMVDGSIIALQHASKPDADNLKGKSVRAIMLDEACAVKHRANWTVLVMRLADSGGQLYFATTPKAGHWLKDEVIDRQNEKEIHVSSLSSRDNPWQSKEELHRSIAVCRDENQVRREIDGQWVGDTGTLWIHFDPRKHTYDDPSFNLPKDRVEVTQQAIRGYFRGGNPYQRSMSPQNVSFIAGQDFNVNPMTTVIAKVFGDPKNPDTWGVCVVDEVVTHHTDTWKHGSWMRSEKCRNGRVSYQGIPIVCDSTACNFDPTRTKGSSHYGSSAAKTLVELGFDARPCAVSPKGYPVNPSLIDSISLMHQLMREGRLLIHGTRCRDLLRALEEQTVKANGLPDKVSNTASDKLSSPIDALRYLCWSLFAPKPKPGKIEVL